MHIITPHRLNRNYKENKDGTRILFPRVLQFFIVAIYHESEIEYVIKLHFCLP